MSPQQARSTGEGVETYTEGLWPWDPDSRVGAAWMGVTPWKGLQ